MIKRSEEISVGDRIQYLLIETGDAKAQKKDLAEDPKYAKEHGLKYNRNSYLSQMAKPLLGFFKCILDADAIAELVEYTNGYIKEYGGAVLRPSDFKLKETENEEEVE